MAIDIYDVYNNTAEKTNRPEYNLQDFAIWQRPTQALDAGAILAIAKRVARGEANPDEQAIYQLLQEQTSGIQARPLDQLSAPRHGEQLPEDQLFGWQSEDAVPILMGIGERMGRGEDTEKDRELAENTLGNWNDQVAASQRDDSFKGIMANLFGNSFTFPALFAAGAMGANLIGGLAGAGGAGSAAAGATGEVAPVVAGGAGGGAAAAGGGGGAAGTGAGLAGALGGAGGAMGYAGWVGPAISAAGSIAGGAMASKASKNAADAQLQAAREATALQAAIYNQQRQDMEPWRQAGMQALPKLQEMAGQPMNYAPYQSAPVFDQSSWAFPTGNYQFTAPVNPVSAAQYAFNPNQYAFNTDQYAFNTGQYDFKPPSGEELLKQDPGYQFRLDQGRKALEASAANRGGLLSGGTAVGLEKYAQGLASQEYGNAYNRALGENQMKYQRGLTGNELAYNRGLTGNQMAYARGLTGNQMAYGRARDENQDIYNRALAENNQWYDRAMQGNQLNYNRAYQQNADEAQRRYQDYITNLQTQMGERSRQYNELANMAGLGQTANSQLANYAGQYGQSAGNNMLAMGNAQAAGRVGASNAWAGALGGLGNAANSYLLASALGNRGGGYNPYSGGGGYTPAGGGYGMGLVAEAQPVGGGGGTNALGYDPYYQTMW